MLKQLVMRVSGLMERLFMGRSLSMAEQLLPNAKPSRAKSTQESQKPAQQSVPQKRKPKSKIAQPITVVASRKQTQKPAQATPGQGGSRPATPASKTRQPASKQQITKQKPAASTKVAKKATKELTRVATPTASKSKARGS